MREAVYGVGGNVPNIATYLITTVDSAGARLNGSKVYKVHFGRDQIPQVEAFWSFTAYTPQFYMEANAQGRYSFGSLYSDLQTNPDGSIDLYFSNVPQGLPNWLPTPQGDFDLVLRLYWPEVPILSGDWTPPAVTEVQ